MNVKVINKSNNPLPKYAKPGDAGMDLMADFSHGFNEKLAKKCYFSSEEQTVGILPGGRCIIPTGLYTSFPEGYEFQIRPRSGLAIKHGITVVNTPGTIDAGYRNEWGVILMNQGEETFVISHGDKIAQGVLTKVEECEWEIVTDLESSERGQGGFGHTGV